LHAVFIPHDNTWILEHEEVATAPASQRLLVVDRFGDLTKHF
jgi:putative hydrolase of the HAD superfamily